MNERSPRHQSEPQPAFTEAAPGFGVTQIDVLNLKPQAIGNTRLEGSLKSSKVMDAIEKEANEKSHIKAILSGKRRAAMILGAGVITFLVGYEGVVRQNNDLRIIRRALEKRWKKKS